jgi:predicted RNase H-like nuclease
VTTGSRVAGVDGFRGRWVIAVVDSGRVEWHLAGSAQEVLDLTEDCAAVAVDVPMGLDDAQPRACDIQARKLLAKAASSVFPAPLRPFLHADTYAEAVRIAREAGLPAPSIQLWNITPGIRDWDEVLTPALQGRVVESHPEVSFRHMRPGPYARKVTARGVGERLDALRPFTDAVAGLAHVPDGPAPDDALDALACAWSARRVATRTAVTLGGDQLTDSRGLRMRIVA